jgi:hypothetical protein
MTPEEIGAAIRAFRADKCPACEVLKKKKSDPFCDACLSRLPADLQEDISDHGLFLEAFHPALSYLNANMKRQVPPGPGDAGEDQ